MLTEAEAPQQEAEEPSAVGLESGDPQHTQW